VNLSQKHQLLGDDLSRLRSTEPSSHSRLAAVTSLAVMIAAGLSLRDLILPLRATNSNPMICGIINFSRISQDGRSLMSVSAARMLLSWSIASTCTLRRFFLSTAVSRRRSTDFVMVTEAPSTQALRLSSIMFSMITKNSMTPGTGHLRQQHRAAVNGEHYDVQRDRTRSTVARRPQTALSAGGMNPSGRRHRNPQVFHMQQLMR
jgi:hypothetical protein